MITIKENHLEDAVAISKQISEFNNLYEIDEYLKRLQGNHLILTACFDGQPVGFKIGYEQNDEGTFYSWMGGVLPEYRKQGIAEMLADYQENWARENGYTTIRLKTREKHKTMQAFSLKRGFVITEKIAKIPEQESRIWMEKLL
jgi:ribosomal protein S18 acetylase RimI-like enzyme